MAGRAVVRRTIGVTGFGNGSVQEGFFSANPTKSAHKQQPKLSNLLFLSSNNTSTTVFASSSSSSHPVAANPSSCFCDNCDNCDGRRLICVADRGKRERKLRGICSKCVFGSVPSKGEVDDALSALLQAVAHYSRSETELDGSNPSSGNAVTHQIAGTASSADKLSSGGPEIEPALMDPHNQRVLQSYGSKKVSDDAFHLLRSEPSIKKMVVSLSTDKAVWDAVLNNEVVREFIGKFCIEESAENSEKGPGAATWISERVFHFEDWRNLFGAERGNAESSEEGPGATAWFWLAKWVLSYMKILVAELSEKILKLLIETSKQPTEGGKFTSPPEHHLEDALRSSLFLTVVILLIVIVSRVNGIS